MKSGIQAPADRSGLWECNPVLFVTYIAIAFLLSDVTFFIFSLEKFIVDGYSFVNTLKRGEPSIRLK